MERRWMPGEGNVRPKGASADKGLFQTRRGNELGRRISRIRGQARRDEARAAAFLLPKKTTDRRGQRR